jgi:NADH-quinone oxidoreductase subunit C
MDERLQPAVEAISEKFGARLYEFRDETSLIVGAEQIVEVCRLLKTEFQFDMLAVETVVDYWPDESPPAPAPNLLGEGDLRVPTTEGMDRDNEGENARFHVVYRLYSFSKNIFIGLRVPLSGNAPHLATIEGVYPNANWHEREIWDMFGIHFDNHSDMRRILMPADWEGHPLRKDYPLGYEEVQFTFNLRDVEMRKPRPKE